ASLQSFSESERIDTKPSEQGRLAMSEISSSPTRRQLLITAAAGIAAVGAPMLLPASAAPAATSDAVRPFRVRIPEKAIADLRRRIAATQWPDKETVNDGSQGPQLTKFQESMRYWGTNYDWRRVEARLNALPMFVTEIDGIDIHF